MRETTNNPQNKNMSAKSANMYSCYICKARFGDKNECKQHMQTHIRKEINSNAQSDLNTVSIGGSNSQNAFVEEHIEDIGVKIKEESKDDDPVGNSDGYYDPEYISNLLKIDLDVKNEYRSRSNSPICKDNLELDNSEDEHSGKGLSSSQKEMLDRYTKAQNGERPYKCSICDEGFFFKQHLNKHMGRMHNWEIPIKCTYCDKTFLQKRILDTHLIRKHTERPFPCDYCDKTYVRKDNLEFHILHKHQLVHNEIKKRPFPCSHCGKAFTKQWYLDIHLRRHTEKKS